MKVELGLSIGYSGADKEEVIEIEDWKWNYIDTWVKIIELPKKDEKND